MEVLLIMASGLGHAIDIWFATVLVGTAVIVSIIYVIRLGFRTQIDASELLLAIAFWPIVLAIAYWVLHSGKVADEEVFQREGHSGWIARATTLDYGI
jgi:hypothetical protein